MILLLRGLARLKEHWGEFPTKLAVATGREVACLDLPGVGDSVSVSPSLSISNIMVDVRMRWLDSRRGAGELIVGHSLGGMVAMEWLAQFPGDFRTGIIINTSTKDTGSIFDRIKPRSAQKLLQIMVENDLKKRELLTLKMISERKETHEKIATDWAELAKRKPIFLNVVAAQIFAASRFHSPEVIRCPLGFIVSSKDKMVAPSCGKKLAKKYSAKFYVNDRAGHDIALDDPDWLAEQIRLHLDSVSHPQFTF